MDPRQVENLKAGPETDAEVEAQFFGHKVTRCDSGFYYVWEGPDAESRAPREFSTKMDEAMKILAACPGWRIWDEDRGITVQFSSHLVIVSKDKETRHVDITGHGLDESLPLAICKAAIYLAELIKAFKELDHGRAEKKTHD